MILARKMFNFHYCKCLILTLIVLYVSRPSQRVDRAGGEPDTPDAEAKWIIDPICIPCEVNWLLKAVRAEGKMPEGTASLAAPWRGFKKTACTEAEQDFWTRRP